MLTSAENGGNNFSSSSSPNFIIVAPSYDNTSGGIVVLHKLCDLINEQGYSAKIFYYHRFPLIRSLNGCGFKHTLLRLIHISLKRVIRGKRVFKLDPEKHEKTTVAELQDLRENTIVIYPEIIYGNPLNHKNVVRWMLYKRKFLPRKRRAGFNELNFYYHKSYLDELSVIEGVLFLTLTNLMEDKYKQSNFGVRQGYCHIVRKGKSRTLDQHPKDSILIDGLTHEETVKVFNEVEFCVSYDLYTALTRFAALCGCKVIIFPEEGVALEKWEPDEKYRYGLAYGWENISWAENTKHLLLRTESQKNQNIVMTKKFLDKCLSHFFS